ncbi:type II toxin-antitoxin system RelE/ParE family toxin, partial [Rhizobium sp. B209b/85]|uniref:type II toxin-antitoxin system RelE/ParE family toxin n=1 Tax=Rhizobium sp. B209b/85 TaxID=2819992 RepID=UPI001ADAA2F9
MSFWVRPLAEADIMGIALYIGERNPAAALKWYDGIYRKFRQLGAMPGTGVARDELREGLIRVLIDQNPSAHSLRPMDMIRQGWLSSLRQASQ